MIPIVIQGMVRNTIGLERTIYQRLKAVRGACRNDIVLRAMTQTQGDNGVVTVILIVEEKEHD